MWDTWTLASLLRPGSIAETRWLDGGNFLFALVVPRERLQALEVLG